MRQAEAFDPIEVGEVDTFAFDFTGRVGDSEIVATQWTCRLTPYSPGADPHLDERIGRVWSDTRAIDSAGIQRNGWFVFAVVGPLPASAAGATYILDAHAYLADGRILAENSTVHCVLPGQ